MPQSPQENRLLVCLRAADQKAVGETPTEPMHNMHGGVRLQVRSENPRRFFCGEMSGR
jgi:nitrate reductase cytochrome c-type subunit